MARRICEAPETPVISPTVCLVGPVTPVARVVEIHRGIIDAQNVMRMRAIEGIELPPPAQAQLRRGGEYHLMLVD